MQCWLGSPACSALRSPLQGLNRCGAGLGSVERREPRARILGRRRCASWSTCPSSWPASHQPGLTSGVIRCYGHHEQVASGRQQVGELGQKAVDHSPPFPAAGPSRGDGCAQRNLIVGRHDVRRVEEQKVDGASKPGVQTLQQVCPDQLQARDLQQQGPGTGPDCQHIARGAGHPPFKLPRGAYRLRGTCIHVSMVSAPHWDPGALAPARQCRWGPPVPTTATPGTRPPALDRILAERTLWALNVPDVASRAASLQSVATSVARQSCSCCRQRAVLHSTYPLPHPISMHLQAKRVLTACGALALVKSAGPPSMHAPQPRESPPERTCSAGCLPTPPARHRRRRTEQTSPAMIPVANLLSQSNATSDSSAFTDRCHRVHRRARRRRGSSRSCGSPRTTTGPCLWLLHPVRTHSLHTRGSTPVTPYFRARTGFARGGRVLQGEFVFSTAMDGGTMAVGKGCPFPRAAPGSGVPPVHKFFWVQGKGVNVQQAMDGPHQQSAPANTQRAQHNQNIK